MVYIGQQFKFNGKEIKAATSEDFAKHIASEIDDMLGGTGWYIDEMIRLTKQAEDNRPTPYWWHWLIRSYEYKNYVYLSQLTPDVTKRLTPAKAPH